MGRATDERDLCAAGNAKKSKKRLAQAKPTLAQYVHSRSAHELEDSLRRDSSQRGRVIEPTSVACAGRLDCSANANP